MAVRQLVLAVILTIAVAGCGSGENPDAGTWVNESEGPVAKLVIGDEDFQIFANVDDTEPSAEGTCVDEDEWTDDAGDTWWQGSCTQTFVDTGLTVSFCILGRTSADGSVREQNLSEAGCPKGHGPDDPPTTRYRRADS